MAQGKPNGKRQGPLVTVVAVLIAIGGGGTLYHTWKSYKSDEVPPVERYQTPPHISLTVQQETAFGLKIASTMTENGAEFDASDAREQEVRQLGAEIVRHSDASKSPYKFQFHLLKGTVVEGNTQIVYAYGNDVNAYAAPGGQVFIDRSLYNQCSDEAELAAILAHEIGHCVERHPAQSFENDQFSLSFAIARGTFPDNINGPVYSAHNIDDEKKADEDGLHFMTQAGFDPTAMIDILEKIEKARVATRPELPLAAPDFLRDHPDPGDRVQAIRKWLADNPTLAGKLTRGEYLPH